MNKMFINADSNDVLDILHEENVKVDLILTDPPYNVSLSGVNGFKSMGRAGMDYGEWDYDFDQTGWIEKATKLLSKDGSIIIFNAWRNLGEIAAALEKQGLVVKDVMRWIKNNPMPRNVERRYVVDFEFIIWAVKKGAKWTFNKPVEVPYKRPEFNYPLTSSKRIHPTQKPAGLLEELIKIHSNEGDLILDPFAGSGSTGVACDNLGRGYIIVELDKEVYDKALNTYDTFK